MKIAAAVVVVLVAVLHLYFMVLEMFLWTTERGRKAFGTTKEDAEKTATLAKNQGLYNGFLAAGLAWSVIAADAAMAFQLKLFFLGCVIVAGVYGAATASKKILFVQALPATIGAILVVVAR